MPEGLFAHSGGCNHLPSPSPRPNVGFRASFGPKTALNAPRFGLFRLILVDFRAHFGPKSPVEQTLVDFRARFYIPAVLVDFDTVFLEF